MSDYIPTFDLNVLATEDDEEDVGFDLNVSATQVDDDNDMIDVNEPQDDDDNNNGKQQCFSNFYVCCMWQIWLNEPSIFSF